MSSKVILRFPSSVDIQLAKQKKETAENLKKLKEKK